MRELVGRGCDVKQWQQTALLPSTCCQLPGRTTVRELQTRCNKVSSCGNYHSTSSRAAIPGHVETAVAMLEEGCPLDVVSGAGATDLTFCSCRWEC